MTTRLRHLFGAILLLVTPTLVFAHSPHQNCNHDHICGLQPKYEVKDHFTPPPSGFEFGGARDVVISVTYNGFTPEAQIAFQYAGGHLGFFARFRCTHSN